MVTHSGYTVPYQLQAWAQLLTELLAELTDELTIDDEDRDDEKIEDTADEEVGVPEHAAPFTVGRSSAPPFLFS